MSHVSTFEMTVIEDKIYRERIVARKSKLSNVYCIVCRVRMFCGIDLGTTSSKASVCDSTGKLLQSFQEPNLANIINLDHAERKEQNPRCILESVRCVLQSISIEDQQQIEHILFTGTLLVNFWKGLSSSLLYCCSFLRKSNWKSSVGNQSFVENFKRHVIP